MSTLAFSYSTMTKALLSNSYVIVAIIGSIYILLYYLTTHHIYLLINKYLLGIYMITAGISHFYPSCSKFYLRIIPPILPFPQELIYVSGMFEIVGAICMCLPFGTTINILGCYLLIIILLAIYPANIYMVILERNNATKYQRKPFYAKAVLRLPLQFIYIYMAYLCAK
eukprot:459006_1